MKGDARWRQHATALELMGQGCTHDEIANKLGITPDQETDLPQQGCTHVKRQLGPFNQPE